MMHLPPLDALTYSGSIRSYSTVPLPATPTMITHTTATSTLTAIQGFIQDVIHTSNANSQPTQRLEGQFHHIQLGELAGGDALMLKYPSDRNIRSLRHETHNLETEFRTISTLRRYTPLPVPEIVDYDSTGDSFGSPYLLTAHKPGQRLSEALSHASIAESKSINRMLGSIVCTLALLSSSQFGPIHEVSQGKGSGSWREAFLALFEAALRDAEDILITLPYELLRHRVGQHVHWLDRIRDPKLVALDICDPDNVLVDEETRQVTALLGLSNVIWGDPLLSDTLANGSEEFCHEYRDLFPREAGDEIRRSIYAVYHAVVRIVAQHYRPHSGIDELEARRSMIHALNGLACE